MCSGMYTLSIIHAISALPMIFVQANAQAYDYMMRQYVRETVSELALQYDPYLVLDNVLKYPKHCNHEVQQPQQQQQQQQQQQPQQKHEN